MDEDQQFCLRWNNHQNTLISVFDNFLESETLVDCTLAAEGQYLKAHKVVLMACSPYLETLLNQHHDKHPILIMKDVKFQELKAMLQYMYRGEVVISPEQIPTFLKAAESLQIKGLTGGDSGDSKKKSSSLLQSLPRSAVPHSDVSNEQKRSSALQIIPQVIVDNQPSSPLYSGDRSISPILRKRRRMHRPSSLPDDYSIHTSRLYPDIHQDTSNNSCDVPPVTVVHSTPSDSNNVPSAESSSNIAKEIKTEDQSLSITDEDGREQEDGDSSNGTGIDDDYRDMMSQAEPGTSGQGFTSIKEEFGIMSQDTPGLNQNQQVIYRPIGVQEKKIKKPQPDALGKYTCTQCLKSYNQYASLYRHEKFECGKAPQFQCPFCPYMAKQKCTMKWHINSKHRVYVS